MDGPTLQQRIYAGYRKAAFHAGYQYEQFRSASPLNPIDPANQVGFVHCMFSAEADFSVPTKYKIPTRYLYADGRELSQRDILVGSYGTFFVGDTQPELPMQAVRCNDILSIDRPQYEGTVVVPVPIASNMPCFRQLKRIDQKPVPSSYGASTAATPIGEWFVYLPVVWTDLRQGDIVTDEGSRKYTISTIDPTEIGTVLVIRQSDLQTT